MGASWLGGLAHCVEWGTGTGWAQWGVLGRVRWLRCLSNKEGGGMWFDKEREEREMREKGREREERKAMREDKIENGSIMSRGSY